MASWAKISSSVGSDMSVRSSAMESFATSAALMQDHHSRTNALHGLEFVRTQQHHLAVGRQFADEIAQYQHGADVETGERLVEQHEVWIVEQCR